MAKKDKRIDLYIAKAENFAKPILNHLRQVIHKACPEIGETIKWGMPFFEYKGAVCNMASFKQHCAIGFWNASLMADDHKIFSKDSDSAMGQFGRINSLKDLPPDKILIEYIKEAAALNEKGIKLAKKKLKPAEKKELVIPDYFIKAISKNQKALKTFNNFSYTNKKEYIDWVSEAKTEDTKNRRLITAVDWMSESKIRNWKYVKK
jgi:uncharacterized protein YdeI (YjbR/CyaY-like superfamily)